MNITSEHVGAVTIPLAVVGAISIISFAGVRGCDICSRAELKRIEHGQVEVYDRVANRMVWRYTTNQSLGLEK